MIRSIKMESMDKRTLIAVVLAVVVLLAYQHFFVAPPPQPLPEQAPPQADTDTQKSPPIASGVSAQGATVKTEATAQARDLKIETDLYHAVFTSQGAVPKSFKLKQYKDEAGNPVSLLDSDGLYAALGIGVQDDFALSRAVFSVRGGDLSLMGPQKASVTFEYTTQQHSVRRTYTFYGDSYRIDLKDEVSGVQDYFITLGDLGLYKRIDEEASHIGPVILKETERIELTAGDLGTAKTYAGAVQWVAQEDKYFFSSIVPPKETIEAKIWKVKETPVVAVKVKAGTNDFIVFAGPKEYDRLKALGVGLEHVIDFGFFSILARPLFWVLKFFYKYTGNYGWAIVLVTVITRVPFVPLLNKSQASMKKMQELQPRFAELREKYKNDPQRLQKEMVEIYKKYKVNPVGGCLPILLQIPVFLALYKVLMISIELRGAPFVLWVTDLSLKDPYYILPIVMGITMVIQQKMTPTTMDPKQAKIMMFLPIVFTIMFLNFASGLVLYWLVNNVLSIAQQYYTNRQLEKKHE